MDRWTGLALISTVVLASAGAAAAQGPVRVSGTYQVGSTLTASVPGGGVRSVRWEFCATNPGTARCTKANGFRRAQGTGRTYLLRPADAGRHVRVIVTITRAGKSRTARSRWSQPVATAAAPTPAQPATPSGGGGARVGIYFCPPMGAGWSYTSILDGGRYNLPSPPSTPGTYTLVDGATALPGGKVFQYSGGSYADTATWRNEYYAEGTVDTDGKVRDRPVIRLGTGGYAWWCTWDNPDPTRIR